MPRHKWMSDLVGDIIDNVGKIFEFSKLNMRTEENYNRIKEITKIVRKNFEKNTFK